MLRILFLISIILFTVPDICAQSKFEPGLIVTLNGRVVTGLIEYHNWSRNPETIVFRDDELKTDAILGVKDIAGFQVRSEVYERAVVTRNVSDISNNNLSENSQPVLEQDTVFLWTLADGQKSFYYLKDRSGKVQLYIGRDHELLIYHKYKIIKDNQVKTITVDLYRQQIKAYLNCPDADSYIENLRYSSNEITRVFEQYFKKCGLNDPKSVTARREGIGMEVGVLAGATASKLSFTGYHFPYLTDYKHDVSTRPTAGAFLHIVIPRTRKNLIVANELAYSSYKISGHHRTEINPENFTATDFCQNAVLYRRPRQGRQSTRNAEA